MVYLKHYLKSTWSLQHHGLGMIWLLACMLAIVVDIMCPPYILSLTFRYWILVLSVLLGVAIIFAFGRYFHTFTVINRRRKAMSLDAKFVQFTRAAEVLVTRLEKGNPGYDQALQIIDLASNLLDKGVSIERLENSLKFTLGEYTQLVIKVQLTGPYTKEGILQMSYWNTTKYTFERVAIPLW